MEIDCGFAQPGDSGGPVVLDEDSSVLGHLVAAFGIKRPAGRYQCGLVQDIHAIVECVEQKYETPITVLDDGL